MRASKTLRLRMLLELAMFNAGSTLNKINTELFGIDSRKQAIVRTLGSSGGGFKSRKAPPKPQYPFCVGEREALFHLHGKAKKRYVKELKLKYHDCRREYC